MAQTPEKKITSTDDESSWLKLTEWAVAIEPELKQSVINQLNSVRSCYLAVLESDMDQELTTKSLTTYGKISGMCQSDAAALASRVLVAYQSMLFLHFPVAYYL